MNKSKKTALIAGSVLIAALIIIPLVFGLPAGWENCLYESEEHGMMGSWMIGGWWIMGIFWIVVIGLIAWLVFYLVRNSGTSTASSISGDVKAVDILKTRYARGEIDKKEYEEKFKALQ